MNCIAAETSKQKGTAYCHNFPNDSASTGYANAFCNFILIIPHKNTNPPPASTWHTKKECARNSMGEDPFEFEYSRLSISSTMEACSGCSSIVQNRVLKFDRSVSKGDVVDELEPFPAGTNILEFAMLI